MDRDEVINNAIEKLSQLTGEDFHGYRSEIWIVLGAVYDSGNTCTPDIEKEGKPLEIKCSEDGVVITISGDITIL